MILAFFHAGGFWKEVSGKDMTAITIPNTSL